MQEEPGKNNSNAEEGTQHSAFSAAYDQAVSCIAIVWALFHLYTGAFGIFDPLRQRSIHLGFALVLIFLLYPGRRLTKAVGLTAGNTWSRMLLAAVSAIVCGYLAINSINIVLRIGEYRDYEVWLSIVLVLILLEATRRMVGNALPIIAICAIVYGLVGGHLPDLIGHRGISFQRIATSASMTTEGIFGVALDVCSTFLILFVFLSVFFREAGVGQFMIDVATAMFGRLRGGPAKVATVASCLFGTVSGSAVANVVGTGSFTIPLMKKLGYSPKFAGAVEAVASTGGQIMPPMMGTSAFIMADILGLPYWQVALAAFIPALLYYISLFFMIDIESARVGLKGLRSEEMPKLWDVLRKGWYLVIPPLCLVVLLIVVQFSPMKSAWWTIIVTIMVSWVNPKTRMGLRKILKALDEGARESLEVAVVCGLVGIVIVIVNITGIGLRLTGVLTTLAGGNLFLLLVLVMVMSIILGMGLPTVGVYLIVAVMVAPAIISMGVPAIAAHMFAFYFGIIANITPPVALAAFAGAGLAGSDPMQTGWTAARLGLAGFIVPFMFVYGPSLVLVGSTVEIIGAFCSACIGCYFMACSMQGYFKSPMNLLERAVFFAGALLLIKPGIVTDAIGLVLGGAGIAFQLMKAGRQDAAKSVGA